MMKWRLREMQDMTVGDLMELQAITQRLTTPPAMPDVIRMVALAYGVKTDVVRSLKPAQLAQRLDEMSKTWGQRAAKQGGTADVGGE